MLAQSPQASDGALDECDNELTWIGVTAKPWPQESRRAWRDDCIAREMRKPHHATGRQPARCCFPGA